jgi:pimeloyl-ACP methyl ester carboxylesterase
MSTWDGVVDELAREHQVVVYDRRGYGQSRHKPVRDHRIHAQLFSALVIVEAPFHGMRHADRHVLSTALQLKLTQLRGRRLEAAEVFYRFGSALRSGGNSYDLAPENIRRNLQANAEPVLAEWDPHPFGVMHEHIPLRAVAGLTVPLTWILGQESSPWMAGLHDRVARQRPDIRTVRIAGAGHLVHLDRPADFIAAVRSASAPPVSPTTSGLWLPSLSPTLADCQVAIDDHASAGKT